MKTSLRQTELLTFAEAAQALCVSVEKVRRMVVEDRALKTACVDSGGQRKPLDLQGLLADGAWRVDGAGRLCAATPSYERGIKVGLTYEPVDIGELRIERRAVDQYLQQLQADSAPQSETGFPPAEMAASVPPKGKRPTSKRRNALDAVIAMAKSQAPDPSDRQSVWAELVALAASAKPPAPLLGFAPTDGVQYRSDSNKAGVSYLTSGAFFKRWDRRPLLPANAR